MEEEILASNYVRLFRDAPEDVRQALRTVDAVDGGTNVLDVQVESVTQLQLLRATAAENRLVLQVRTNQLTGEPGLIVVEGWTPTDSTDARVVAELLGLPGEPWQAQTEFYDQLFVLARRNQLSIVTHGVPEQLTAFVVHMRRRADGALEWWYYARLLMTDSQLAQWSDEVRR